MAESMLDALRLLRIALNWRRDRADLVYDVLGRRHTWSQRSLFLNLGYWRGASQIDEAGTALAELVGEHAGLVPGDRVLDAGFGFGDQDLFWMRRFGPLRIEGLNVSPTQVLEARRRIAAAGMAGEVHLRLGDAAAPPFADDSFDKVLAVESAFHFRTRTKFLSAACRVLRPGGTLVLTDFVLAQGDSRTLPARLGLWFGTLAWQIPSCNLRPLDLYIDQLAVAGFSQVEAIDITHDVIDPFRRYLQRWLDEHKVISGYHPLVRLSAKLQLRLGFLDRLSYYLIVARK